MYQRVQSPRQPESSTVPVQREVIRNQRRPFPHRLPQVGVFLEQNLVVLAYPYCEYVLLLSPVVFETNVFNDCLWFCLICEAAGEATYCRGTSGTKERPSGGHSISVDLTLVYLPHKIGGDRLARSV